MFSNAKKHLAIHLSIHFCLWNFEPEGLPACLALYLQYISFGIDLLTSILFGGKRDERAIATLYLKGMAGSSPFIVKRKKDGIATPTFYLKG